MKITISILQITQVMANCVRRSQVLNAYSTKLVYGECITFPSFFAGFVYIVDAIMMGTVVATPPLSMILVTAGILPRPGTGPSKGLMDAGYLRVTAYASGERSENKLKAQFYFPTDPGYRDTARMLVESGLVLVLDEKKLKVGGGVWTPASCQAEILTQRLLTSGSELSIVSIEA